MSVLSELVVLRFCGRDDTSFRKRGGGEVVENNTTERTVKNANLARAAGGH